ncbi:transposase, IS605 OrfB [Pyrobaculum islandicum DSM 4184]|uniref:Transposase, IS605 OrfB n=1 Tax=Pyrobaculum islandicum (strain DSM 4184 / JCM 9189 / GEO3) TaxID=384616 RepID=A1RVA0_PYRIL|nr:transposase, IS605 OrfB [Pyrobaculum islandicum DSM 4184]
MVFHRAVPLDAQLRVENERDVGNAVFVDLKSGVVKVRRLQETLIIHLKRQSAEWIRRRVEEGAKLKLAFLGIERRKSKKPTYGKLYVAPVFAREMTPAEPKTIITVDINRLDHGVMVGLLVDGKLRQTLRLPDKDAIKTLKRLHEEISKLEKQATRETDLARRKRLEERVRYLKSKRYRKIRGVITQIAGEIIKLAREHKAAIVVDTIEDGNYRMLKEGNGSGEKKHFLDGLGQLRRRLQALAHWYDIPYLEERLYSTVCPKCGANMAEERGHIMRCPACGFTDHRDRIPLLWAKRRYWELLQKTKQPRSPHSGDHLTFNRKSAHS